MERIDVHAASGCARAGLEAQRSTAAECDNGSRPNVHEGQAEAWRSTRTRFSVPQGRGKPSTTYQPTDVIFSQGDAADSVLYIQKGAVKLSVLSPGGKEAVVAMLGPGDFFGEQALAGHPVRLDGRDRHDRDDRADHPESSR